ncbi:MAG: heavy-metal-associated domain-containing protein [Phycisphaerales bacterium]|nr:heavy-metal-associated domain-containing protein [Phycisphaerales bacterium]
MNMPTAATTTISLTIFDMSCDHCVRSVTRALTATPGIKIRSISLGSAIIEASDGGAAAVAALDEVGYPARATPMDKGKGHAGGCSCGGRC